ncbi:hypothetical protein HK104_003679 [Borealophlyctis nickersoniae]|nr:hypothetical protein HK104_003679 [Borealophlyctis nickersoniae]
MMRQSQSQTTNQASEKSDSKSTNRVVRRAKVRIPLVVVLLGTTLLVAAFIAIPIAVLSFSGGGYHINKLLQENIANAASREVGQLVGSCLDALNDLDGAPSIKRYLKDLKADITTNLTNDAYPDV